MVPFHKLSLHTLLGIATLSAKKNVRSLVGLSRVFDSLCKVNEWHEAPRGELEEAIYQSPDIRKVFEDCNIMMEDVFYVIMNSVISDLWE